MLILNGFLLWYADKEGEKCGTEKAEWFLFIFLNLTIGFNIFAYTEIEV